MPVTFHELSIKFKQQSIVFCLVHAAFGMPHSLCWGQITQKPSLSNTSGMKTVLHLENPGLSAMESTVLPGIPGMLRSTLPGKAFFELLAPTHMIIPIYVIKLFPFLFHCTALGLSVSTLHTY